MNRSKLVVDGKSNQQKISAAKVQMKLMVVAVVIVYHFHVSRFCVAVMCFELRANTEYP